MQKSWETIIEVRLCGQYTLTQSVAPHDKLYRIELSWLFRGNPAYCISLTATTPPRGCFRVGPSPKAENI